MGVICIQLERSKVKAERLVLLYQRGCPLVCKCRLDRPLVDGARGPQLLATQHGCQLTGGVPVIAPQSQQEPVPILPHRLDVLIEVVVDQIDGCGR